MKILIIEDDPGIIEDLAATLTVSDYQIIKVNNGYEALKIIKSLNKRSDIMKLAFDERNDEDGKELENVS